MTKEKLEILSNFYYYSIVAATGASVEDRVDLYYKVAGDISNELVELST